LLFIVVDLGVVISVDAVEDDEVVDEVVGIGGLLDCYVPPDKSLRDIALEVLSANVSWLK
jgi:hypothetical protein